MKARCVVDVDVRINANNPLSYPHLELIPFIHSVSHSFCFSSHCGTI